MHDERSTTRELPPLLQREADQALSQLREAARLHQGNTAGLAGLLDHADHCRELRRLLSCSQYAAQLVQRHPDWLLHLYSAGHLHASRNAGQWLTHARAELGQPADVDTLDRTLRQFRNREMLRILWRDFNRLADTAETTADTSYLAEITLQAALDFHYDALCRELGTPTSDAGVQQRLVVLGMGKLGAHELNLSSDIDLIFAYPESGETQGVASPIHNQEFFTRLGQRLIKSLDAITPDGFVFRVDMRLRPYGDSGALVLSFDAMEEYYQDQGRDWERYAMIKARPVAGDMAAGARLLEALRPFVYRRYVDFSVFDALRDMKRMIQREVQRRRLHDNIKLGSGGIREVEFIAQCFQLIRGGRDRVLQERRLQPVLVTLAELGLLPADAAAELATAYDFLRDTEHALQGWLDRQTQELPTADLPRAALAHVMGYADWAAYSAALQRHRERVAHHFGEVIAAPEEEQSSEETAAAARWRPLWVDSSVDIETWAAALREAGHEEPEDAARLLLALRSSQLVLRTQSVGRQRLDAFMPQLLMAVTQADRPSEVLRRILPFVEAVVRRTAYLVLVVENPGVLRRLVQLCAASPWIATQLARHPVLLDELLERRDLFRCPPKQELQADLRQQMLRIAWDDLEAQMEQLRYFKQAHVLRVIAAEVTGQLPLMKVSDYLTWLAETILEHVLELAWHYMTARHGVPVAEVSSASLPSPRSSPRGRSGASSEMGAEYGVAAKDFLIIGYGKLGGIELSHSSDLDLVFIHDGSPGSTTDGPSPLDGATFYTRLGQRIIHILTAQSPLGPLYEVDMRLRPSGNSGLLVSSLKAFSDYQHNSAWTWEHQALVRARPVAGDPALAERFEQVRRELLCRPRDPDKLRAEVVEMREKMIQQHAPKDPGLFDLKHSRGGIVDIEFMVQYAALAWAHQHPTLTRWTDNIRLLETLAEVAVVPAETTAILIQTYKSYRTMLHRLSLQQQTGSVPITQVDSDSMVVKNAWQKIVSQHPE